MAQAILDKVGADIEANDYTFRATGQTIKFPGFMEVYLEGKDHEEDEKEDKEKILPKLEQDDPIDLEKLNPDQHFTKPPPRYTEASLVKKLESEGIGRPSTYAPTISTIMTRGYIEKEAKQLVPTDTAMVVTDLLVDHFKDIVDYKFTAEMEDKLDGVEEGKEDWTKLLSKFYKPFHKNIEEKMETLKKSDITSEETDEVCDKCGSEMVIKLGRFGKFLSCSNYPECKNAKPLAGEGKEKKVSEEQQKKIEELTEKFKDKKCDKCGKPMEIKVGRFGPFLGCSGYPDCKNIVNTTEPTGIKCPECGKGDIAERRTKRGKIFWGCTNFPKCKNATWEKPVGTCEKCGALVTEDKEGKKKCTKCG